MDEQPISEPVFSPLVVRAIELASEWHEGTYRKGRWRPPPPTLGTAEDDIPVPTIAHLTAVGINLQRAGWDAQTVAAGFLHDILEDRNREGAQMTPAELAKVMNDRIATWVEAVSEHVYGESGQRRPWHDRKKEYLAQINEGPDEVVAISVADKGHNLWTMNEALVRDIDLFSPDGKYGPFRAEPEDQYWLIHSLLEIATDRSDQRLAPLRQHLAEELKRFKSQTNAGS